MVPIPVPREKKKIPLSTQDMKKCGLYTLDFFLTKLLKSSNANLPQIQVVLLYNDHFSKNHFQVSTCATYHL